MRTVIRTQGKLSLSDHTSFSFLSRITVFVNGQISTNYAVINHQISGFHGYGVQLRLPAGFETVQLQDSAIRLRQADGGESAKADTIGIRQTSPKIALLRGTAGHQQPVATRHHGGMQLRGESKSLGLAISDFW